MSQEESMRIVAEVVDKFSQPLRDLRSQLGGVKSPQGARGLSSDLGKIDKGVKEAAKGLKESLTPALSTFNLQALTVGGAIAAVAAGLRGLQGNVFSLSLISRDTGIAVNKMRQLQYAGEAVGLSGDALSASFEGFARNMKELRAGVGGTLSTLFQQGDKNVRSFALSLRSVGSNEAALERILRFMQRINDPIDRQRFVQAFGLPAELARVTGKGIDVAANKVHRASDSMMRDAKELHRQWQEVGQDWQNLLVGLADLGALKSVSLALRTASSQAEVFGTNMRAIWRGLHGDVAGADKILADAARERSLRWADDLRQRRAEIDRDLEDARKAKNKNYVSELEKQRAAIEKEMALQKRLAPGAPPVRGPVDRGKIEPLTMDRLRARLGLPGAGVDSAGGGGGGGWDTKNLKPLNFRGMLNDLGIHESWMPDKNIEKGTAEGAKKGVLDGLREWWNDLQHRQSFTGGGNGMPRAIPASYTVGGRDGARDSLRRFAALPPPDDSGGRDGPGKIDPMGTAAASSAAGMGKYRRAYQLHAADLSDAVVNTIAGEAYTNNRSSVDAVINNMINRVGTKTYGPSSNLRDVAMAPGQYAGHRRASPKEADFIRSRIKAIASGSVPDITKGSNEFRASYYRGPWYQHHLDAPVIGGNRFAFNPRAGRGPFAPYTDADLAKLRHQVWGAGAKPFQYPGLTLGADDAWQRQATRQRLAQGAQNAGIMGGVKVDGGARVQIDLNGAPRGTRVKSEVSGIFDRIELNRGRAMPSASQQE